MDRANALERARELVTGERNEEHGDAHFVLKGVAEMWSTYLSLPVAAYDVAAMMALLKIARLQQKPGNTENWVDGAGYLALGVEMVSGWGEPDAPPRPTKVASAPSEEIGLRPKDELEKIFDLFISTDPPRWITEADGMHLYVVCPDVFMPGMNKERITADDLPLLEDCKKELRALGGADRLLGPLFVSRKRDSRPMAQWVSALDAPIQQLFAAR